MLYDSAGFFMIGFTAAAVAGPQRGSGGVFVMLSCLHFLFYSTFFQIGS